MPKQLRHARHASLPNTSLHTYSHTSAHTYLVTPKRPASSISTAQTIFRQRRTGRYKIIPPILRNNCTQNRAQQSRFASTSDSIYPQFPRKTRVTPTSHSDSALAFPAATISRRGSSPPLYLLFINSAFPCLLPGACGRIWDQQCRPARRCSTKAATPFEGIGAAKCGPLDKR